MARTAPDRGPVWGMSLLGMALALCSTSCDEAAGDVEVAPTREQARQAKCWREAKPLAVEEEPAPTVSCGARTDAWDCYGSWAARCRDGRLLSLENCRVDDQACAPAPCRDRECVGGCLACVPGSARCDGDQVLLCKRDGSGYEEGDRCADGLKCDESSGACVDLCAQAVAGASYVGCEYWAVPTVNSHLTDVITDGARQTRLCALFPFALVLSNTEGVVAHVTVTNPSDGTMDLTVEPGAVEVLRLPCGAAPSLRASSELLGPQAQEPFRTRVSSGAAYHVVSDVPVTVYQFNPLEFSADFGGEDIFSYTNDASLLLPVHALTGNYTVMTRPTWSVHRVDGKTQEMLAESHFPGFVSVTATAEGQTEVMFESAAHTRRSDDGAIPALAPGDSHRLTLGQGETVQFLSAEPSECVGSRLDSLRGVETRYCQNGRAYDLTGSRVRADAPVSVIAGHDCTYVPSDKAACDHLEEAMFPEETLGRRALVSVVEPVTCDEDIPTFVRIVSTADDNTLTFSPPLQQPRTLSAGELFEFEAVEDFMVEAEAPVLVGQFLVGQQYERGNTRATDELGDPAFSLLPPVEQWRDRYVILVPETLPDSFVNIVSQEGARVIVDGRLLDGLTPIGDTGFAATRVTVGPGSHRLQATHTFGVTVYGYASYTSYMIPGGLDLMPINAPQ